MKKSLPSVVIVGRTNVGKSTLFNRLSDTVKSLTFDQPGVTRDVITNRISWQGVSFELIDSGGIAVAKTHDPMEQKVRAAALDAIKHADLIVFMTDGTTGLLPEDRAINDLLFSLNKTTLLVVNKIDTQHTYDNLYEFYQLGHGEPILISAQHGTGSGDLLSAIVAHLKKAGMDKEIEESPVKYRVVLLGKPNVGKSSLMNLLVAHERSIVSDIAGTTREAVTAPIVFHKETIQMIDTPGIRRKRGVTEDLEQLMVHSAFQAIKRSDIILLLIDGAEGRLSDQELKLAFYVFEQYKGLIILFNKNDITTSLTHSDLAREVHFYNPFLRKIPQLFISCLTGENIGSILPLIDTVWRRYSQRLNDLETTELLKNALSYKPLYHQSKLLILYKAKQVKTAPVTLALFVNEPAWFGPSQLSFFENILREHYDLKGVPVKFSLRKNND